MHRRVPVVLALLAIGTGALSGERPRQEGSPLLLELSVSPATVNISEQVALDVRLRNLKSWTSPEEEGEVTVFGSLGWGYGAGLALNIRNETGEVVHEQNYSDRLVPPSEFKRRESFVTLQPDHYLGTVRQDPARELFPRPGRYVVWVEYASPASADISVKLRGLDDIWWRGRGRLRSNEVEIVVVDGTVR